MYDPKHWTLDEDLALVTETGAETGRAIALIFAAAGPAVMASDLDKAAAQTLLKHTPILRHFNAQDMANALLICAPARGPMLTVSGGDVQELD